MNIQRSTTPLPPCGGKGVDDLSLALIGWSAGAFTVRPLDRLNR